MQKENQSYHSRRLFLSQIIYSGIGLSVGFLGVGCEANKEDGILNLVTIGNIEDEKIRYQMLQELLEKQDLDNSTLQQLTELLPYIHEWANGKEIAETEWQDKEQKRYLPGPVRAGAIDNNIPPQPPEDSPVYPLWCWYRSRILIWRSIEYGEILGNPELLAAHYGEAQRLLKVSQKAFPKNGIIGMYLGEQRDWPVQHRPSVEAPTWALDQKVALAGLQDIIHWWIDNRQLADGQYGGGWGDDVEMWRWWTPLLIGLQDEKVNAAQKKLSQGLFQLEKMKGGYTNQIDDVEHTAEDSADTITAMMHINPDAEEWRGRAMHLVNLMKEVWTGVNERGFLQFKSTYFTDSEVDLTPRKACDTVYHPRAVQPALLLWQRTHNPALTAIFTSWLRTWVDAAGRAERGKPAGIIPSAIHWPDGQVGGLGKDWWKPGNYTDNPLYVWPSNMGMMTNSLLLAFHITGDRSFLKPIISMAEIRMNYLQKKDSRPDEPGSADWCAAKMPKFLTATLAKYRVLTGDTQFDELLKLEKDPYLQYSFFGNEQLFEVAMQENALALSKNFPIYTSEMRWTDRILNFNHHYLKEIYPEVAIPDAKLLYRSITGDPGGALYFPLNGFQWLIDHSDLAVRVKEQSSVGARIELFGFYEGSRKIKLKTFLLKQGSYSFQLNDAKGGALINEQRLQLNEVVNIIELDILGNRSLNLVISN